MSYPEFNKNIQTICNCCLKSIKDSHELHIKRGIALELIQDIIERANPAYVQSQHVVHLIWSMMSCIHHFQLRFRSASFSLITWSRKMEAKECTGTYNRLIRFFPKSMHRIILNSLIIFYTHGRLWTVEFRITDLICDLLYLYEDIEEAIEDIVSAAETSSLRSVTKPAMLMRVLYEILAVTKWAHISEKLIKRFLAMLRKSIVPKEDDPYNYVTMKRGLIICFRHITDNLNNNGVMKLLVIVVKKITQREMDADYLLYFGGIAEYAALCYNSQLFIRSFPTELIDNLWILLSSDNNIRHLFASRILRNLMDRHNNKAVIETPRIYFQGVQYNIKLSKYSARDKLFYKKHRAIIHRVIMTGIRKHYNRRTNLENIYSLLATVSVEIPCSYVASSIVCLAMNMQEFARSQSPDNMIACHHVHGIVISLMSLICYIFKANIFYDYVMLLVEKRSTLAPHLNPPLKAEYKYAQHHLLWDKPDLFFEDWEARYGLWKCFRNIERRRKLTNATPNMQRIYLGNVMENLLP